MTQIDVAILGFGNIGRAFARYADGLGPQLSKELRIRAAADSSGGVFLATREQLLSVLAKKETGHKLRECAADLFVEDVSAFVGSLAGREIRILVESLPTNISDGQPGLDLIRDALEAGISVVTIDKGPLVHGLGALVDTSRDTGSKLAYSGATGVRAPAALSACRVLEISGILNGTTNYILAAMHARALSFEEALQLARARGITEPDPRLDLEGWDTACKILILAKAWIRPEARLADVMRTGIGTETESLIREAHSCGGVVRLIGRAITNKGELRLTVAPEIVGPDSPFYAVSGTEKGVLFRTLEKGDLFASSRSGRDAICRTILEDLFDLASD